MKTLRTVFCFLLLFLLIEAKFFINQSGSLMPSCIYIKHQIVFEADGTDEFFLTQNGQQFNFESGRQVGSEPVEFTLNLSEQEQLLLGQATITQKTKELNTYLKKVFLINYNFEPALKEEKHYDSITITTQLECKNSIDNLKFYKIGETGLESQVTLPKTNVSCGYSFEVPLPGRYVIKAQNPFKEDEEIIVETFTQTEDITSLHKHQLIFDYPLPTLFNGSNTVTITYPDMLGEIRKIQVRINDDKIFLNINKEPTDGNFFTTEHHDNNYIVKCTFKFKGTDYIYQIANIIFNSYQTISFDDNEIEFGHVFKIIKQYYLHQKDHEVTLLFSSPLTASKYINQIMYRQLDGFNVNTYADCTQSSSTLKCQFTSSGTSLIGFGIGNCFMSAQEITVFSINLHNSEILENNCFIENSIPNENELQVSFDFPEKTIPNQINGYLVNEASNSEFCETLNESGYTVKCQISGLTAGNYFFQTEFNKDENTLMSMHDIALEVKKSYSVVAISPNTFTRISSDQEIVIEFNEAIDKGEINSIKLVSSTKESKLYSVQQDSKSSKKKFLINGLDQQKLSFGTYAIYYNSPCLDNQSFIASDKNIQIIENQIKSVTPSYIVLSKNTSSSIITYEYEFGEMLKSVVFHSKYDRFTVEIKDFYAKSVEVFSTMAEKQEVYTIETQYTDIKKKTNFKLFVFNDLIALQKTIDYVHLNSNVTYIIIPLTNEILREQIQNVTSKEEGSSVETNCTFSLTKDNNAINVTLVNKFDKLGYYNYYIYDVVTNAPVQYTIQCTMEVNLAVAEIDISIINPAKYNENFIEFVFHSYNTSRIHTIMYTKVNRANGNEVDFKFCKEEMTGCDGVLEDITLNSTIRTNIVYDVNEIYLYKYVLRYISDETITRYFNVEKEEYVLLDFSVSHNIFGILEGEGITDVSTIFELYVERQAEQLANSTTCKIENECGSSKPNCTESCSNDCNQVCSVNCVKQETAMACNFNFGTPITQETTIYYKFADFDLNYKPLHILKIIPPESICNLSDFDDNLNMQICSHSKVNHLKMFLGEDVDPNCDCSGLPITWNENARCTDISVQYTYFLENPVQMKVIRNMNEINSFQLEINTTEIHLIDEIMLTYQGKLVAQLQTTQTVKYIFPTNSDASKIKSIILTHQETQEQIIADETQCKVGAQKEVIECFYNLESKTEKEHLGTYTISYYHEECEQEFSSGITITIEAPPIILSYITPPYSWLGESEEFVLKYHYYFYEGSCYIPTSLTLVKVDDDTQRRTVTLYSKTRSEMYFRSEINFVEMGYYYVIEHFGSCMDDNVHKDKTILFYLNKIDINPKSVTYYSDEPAPYSTLTHFIYTPIISEQIISVTLNNIDVQYIFSPTNITFIFTPGLIDFTQPGNHSIIITTISGDIVTFTVEVIYRITLAESDIIIDGPIPGYENTTNIVHFISNYDLTKLARIVFLTLDENGNEYEYIVERNTIIENYCNESNAINLPLYLYHNNYYKYKEMFNIFGENTSKGNYTLKGFFVENHFFFLQSNVNVLYYRINFYSNNIAQKTIGRIRQNNIIQTNCQIDPYATHIVKCPYVFEEKKHITLPISIDENATEDKVLPIYIMDAYFAQTCFTTKYSNENILLNILAESNVGSIRGHFNNDIIHASSEYIETDNTWHYTINFNYPILYASVNLDVAVDFQRHGEFYPIPLPNGNIRFINHADIADIITKYIDPTTEEERLLKIKLTHNVTESDLSHVELVNINDSSEIISIENCSLYLDRDDNVIYTCDVSQIQQYQTFIVHVYNSCNQLLSPKTTFYVHFSKEYNYLQQITPMSVNVKELNETTFTFIYNNSMKKAPANIELVNKNNDVVSNYKVTYSPNNQDSGTTIYLTVTLSNSNEIGLFRIRTTFDPSIHMYNNTDDSQLAILIYENEISFTKPSESLTYGTSLQSVSLFLEQAIIAEQISQITYQPHDTDTSNEIIAEWELISSRKIKVYFKSEFKLEDNYIISITSAKDYSTKLSYQLNVLIQYSFDFSREFIDMGESTQFSMTITPINDIDNTIHKIEANTDEVEIITNEETKNFYDETGVYIRQETRIWFTLNYVKTTSFTLPKEINFVYYFKNVSEPYAIDKVLHITDSVESFFDYGNSVNKTYYKGSTFEIELISNKNIDYVGLGAFLKFADGIEKDLIHDTAKPNKFYLDMVMGIGTQEGELIVYEKGNRDAIVDQGQLFTFSDQTGPEVSNNACLNNGQLVGKYCKCPNGFYGTICSYTQSNVDDYANEFIQDIVSQGVNIKNQVVVQELLELVAIGQNRVVIIPSMEEYIEQFETVTPENEVEAEGYFAYASVIIEGENNAGRRLSESQRKRVLKRTKQVAEEWSIPEGKEFSTFVLPLQNIYYHKIKATSKAFEAYKQEQSLLKNSFIELINKDNGDDNEGFFLLSANEEQGEYIKNKKPKVAMKLQYYPSRTRLLKENDNNEFYIHFSGEDFPNVNDETISSNENILKIDYELFEFYNERGVNIYNSEDPFFTDKCYSVDPSKFDFDLTQKYRKKLTNNTSFVLNENSNCKYESVSDMQGYITYLCTSSSLSEDVSVDLELKETELSKASSKVENSIPLKCIGKLTKIHTNIAFWLFFVLMLLMINCVLFLLLIKFVWEDKQQEQAVPTEPNVQQKPQSTVTTTEDKSSFPANKMYNNNNNHNNAIQIEDKPINDYAIKPKNNNDNVNLGNIHLQFTTPTTFSGWFIHNIKLYHPITANYFCKERYLHVIIFVFSITTMFAFDAILFKESYIDDRVKEKSRDSFRYPLKHEAGVVFGAIFIAWLISAVPKGIYHFLMDNNLPNVPRMILSIAFLVICVPLMFLWWVYCIGFCGMYKNTQFGWFYACIWGLLFDWILFAPVFVVIVSVLDYKLGDSAQNVMLIVKEIARF